jgi:hypothetical protein
MVALSVKSPIQVIHKGYTSRMDIQQWAALAVAIMTLIGGFAALVRWLVKHYLIELKPNGGSSLRDEQNRQGDTIKRLELRIDEIYALLLSSKKGRK